MNKKIIFAIIAVIIIVAVILGVNILKKNRNGGIETKAEGVYRVGKELSAGTYEIDYSNAEYSGNVVVFLSEADYQNFEKAERYTVGEFADATRAYSWADFYIYKGNKALVGLKNGYIVYVGQAGAKLNKYDVNSSNILHPGVYVAGEDISSGNYDIKGTSSYMKVILFDNKDKYMDYLRAPRATVGEEGEAIQKYGTSKSVSKDKTISINLQKGMIMKIEDGSGEYTVK